MWKEAILNRDIMENLYPYVTSEKRPGYIKGMSHENIWRHNLDS